MGTQPGDGDAYNWHASEKHPRDFRCFFRVKYIDEYRTHDDSNPDRVDLLFALHEDDVNRMVTDRFTTFNGEVKWYEDYVVNSKSVIPKSRVLPNVTW